MVTLAPVTEHIHRGATARMNLTLHARSHAIRETALEYYFALLGGHWRKVRNRLDSYTILIPVVPEFYPVTELNLRFLLSCDLTHCRELILVADSRRYRAENLFVIRRHATGPRIRYVVLIATKRLLLQLHRTPYVVHATNLTAGANLAAAEYLFLHDMDFFLIDSGYTERTFREMQRGDLVSAYTRNYPNGPPPAV